MVSFSRLLTALRYASIVLCTMSWYELAASTMRYRLS